MTGDQDHGPLAAAAVALVGPEVSRRDGTPDPGWERLAAGDEVAAEHLCTAAADLCRRHGGDELCRCLYLVLYALAAGGAASEYAGLVVRRTLEVAAATMLRPEDQLAARLLAGGADPRRCAEVAAAAMAPADRRAPGA